MHVNEMLINNTKNMVNTLKQVYNSIYSNTHPFVFVYTQRQKIRSMTAITTKPCAMASPRSRVLVAPQKKSILLSVLPKQTL